MFFKEIGRILGRYLLYFTLLLIIPLIVAFIYESETQSTAAFLITLAISFSLGIFFKYLGRDAEGILHRKEGILLVILIWLISTAIGALPFYLTGLLNPLDAYFEAMSGLTTTGATLITDLETVASSLLFWRSFLQWLGGMGIVVLFIAILPALSMGGRFLFEAEAPGPDKESLKPRIRETASLLWKIYLSLTLFQVTLLMLTNSQVTLFEAVTLSFSTISTGGFSVHSDSIAGYQNSYTQWIITAFMILGGINFSLYFQCIKGKIYRIYEPEFFAYFLILLFSSLIMTWTLRENYPLSEAFRYGFFQAISAQTSTGFSVTSTQLWPISSQLLMFLLIFIGGMSGSTSGGFKISRHLIGFSTVAHKLKSLFSPDSISRLKIGHKEVTDKTALTILSFFFIAFACLALGVLLLTFDGIDPSESLKIIGSMMNNAGIYESYTFLPSFSKIISILWMLLGRLEFFALLILFFPSFWKN